MASGTARTARDCTPIAGPLCSTAARPTGGADGGPLRSEISGRANSLLDTDAMGRGRATVAQDRFSAIFGNRRGLRAYQQSHHSSDASVFERAADGTKIWRRDGKLHREDGPAVERPDGTKQWWLDGQQHREGGPAVERANGTKEWWLGGQRHREDGPAVEWAGGTKAWWLYGQQHREGRPAVERADGTKEWWLDGKLHREDGPAVERANGTKAWWLYGQRHREDGPAIEYPDGTKEWWLDGQRHREARLRELPLARSPAPVS